MEVEFTDEEEWEYVALNDTAWAFYLNFKANRGKELSKHYLLLTQKLMPLHITATGGHIPLENEDGDNHSMESIDVEEKEDSAMETPKKKRAKKEQLFSEFVFESKFNALLEELKHARDDNPNGKSLHCIDMYGY